MNNNPESANDIVKFVEENIQTINKNIRLFSETVTPKPAFKMSDILRYLHSKFEDTVADEEQRNSLWDSFAKVNFVKNRIQEIANENVLYHKDLERFYQSAIFSELASAIDSDLIKSAVETMVEHINFPHNKSKYAMSQLKPIAEKAMYLALRNGFVFNRHNMEEGIMTANAGDSAQFLFLARAILAGYNCSNVDVRSSRYDAVIDQNGRLFRVQVKGISGSALQFRDRDRGGEGIDHRNKRNIGKRITASDCDIYVGVDKQIGICYIIPVSKIDEWGVDTKRLKDVADYKENWQVIDDLANNTLL